MQLHFNVLSRPPPPRPQGKPTIFLTWIVLESFSHFRSCRATVRIKHQNPSLYSSGFQLFRKNRIYTGVHNTRQRKRGCKSDKGGEEAVSGSTRTLGRCVRVPSQGLVGSRLQSQRWGGEEGGWPRD